MIKIVKVYDKQQPNTHREYCGRPGKGELGLLGNPFWMKDESQRNKCCDEFHTWFGLQMNINNGKIHQRVNELIEIAKTQDIELACFCSPKRCHTETIKAYIEQQLLNDYILSTFDDSWADDPEDKSIMTYVNGEWIDARTLTMEQL